MDIMTYFHTGGPTMYILLICSIMIWAIAFEKWWTLWRFQRGFSKLVRELESFLKEKKVAEAIGLCRSVSDILSGPILTLLQGNAQKQDARDARIVRRIQETQMSLKKYIWILGSIGATAPFIGLFGTVMGIIESFASIQKAGKSGFSVVAGGLSEALVTTAAGILVAIVAVLFYNYFQARLSRIALELRNSIGDLSDLL